MARPILLFVLVLSFLLAMGCSNKVAEKVTELRKSGNMEGAHDLAVSALKDDPSLMRVWRELALTDLELARMDNSNGVEKCGKLFEAGLICAAYQIHKNGKLDEAWRLLIPRISITASNTAKILLSELNKKRQMKNSTSLLRKLAEEEGENSDAPPPVERTEITYVIDPSKYQRLTPRITSLLEMTQALAPGDTMIALQNREILDQMSQLVSYTGLSETYLEHSTQATRAKVKEAIQAAVENLKDTGYLDAATVFNMSVIE